MVNIELRFSRNEAIFDYELMHSTSALYTEHKMISHSMI